MAAGARRVPFFDLTGRHALVTGATGPLARALAVALAEAGADVSVTTLQHDRAEEVQANSILNECWAIGRRGEARTVDLTDPRAVAAAVDALERSIAPIDILVNAGHHANIKPALDATVAEWNREIARNATAVFVASQAVARGMIQRRYGRIVNIVSILYDRGASNAALYAASQGAVLGFTRSAGIEWGHAGVTVNALGIGIFDGVPGPQSDPELHAFFERYLPMRRPGKPEDLQGALVYLASAEAGFVLSELLVVDGALQPHM
ncbi:MAG: SDR family oxidoreductase [Dehalococcoidia bacterium]|nr:SDR family oxidoreductase [Dehalococcoidia bacterium]